MLRRVAVVVAGLAMTASIGLAGVCSASAASPALHIKPDSMWTLEVKNGGCEEDIFQSNRTFSSDVGGDAGTWSGCGATIAMNWTSGSDAGQKFSGTFVLHRVAGQVQGTGKPRPIRPGQAGARIRAQLLNHATNRDCDATTR
jgi:hypothetical protein